MTGTTPSPAIISSTFGLAILIKNVRKAALPKKIVFPQHREKPASRAVKKFPHHYPEYPQGWDDIMMNRKAGFSMRGVGGPGAKGGVTPPATGRTSSTRKVACPCCGQSVRATKKVNIICGDCLVPMAEV